MTDQAQTAIAIEREEPVSRKPFRIHWGDIAIYATLTNGDFFGEIALLLSQPRTASIRALDYCDLYALSKETFDRVLGHYPDFAKHIQSIARQRQAQHR